MSTKTKPTATERRDHHDAYHTSGMMEVGCQSCTEMLRRAPAVFAFQDHYTESYIQTLGCK
ncbi:MAG: hypothetical protein V3S68_04665 [Dehalococcoidia bacterium]